MGQEVVCKLRRSGQVLPGTAYLEGDHILFRGVERVKIRLRELTKVSAADGVLELEYPEGPASLELGAAAARWAEKILHPPTRLDKLGVKPGMVVSVEGALEPAFLREAGIAAAGVKAGSDLIFLAAETRTALDRIAKLRRSLTPAGGLWVVYPKGVEAIREIEVIEAGRAAGLKDNKVASFSATHTALRFVIPVAERPAKAKR
jgi:hypothetical protein